MPTTVSPAIGVSLEAQGAAVRPEFRLFWAARLLLVAALLAAPLAFGAVPAWSWASLAVLAVMALFLWTAECVQQRAVRVVWSPLYLPGALFLLLGAIQLSGHITRDAVATREALLKLATDVIFFFLAGQLFGADSKQTWHALGLMILAYAFVLSLFAIAQFFSSQELIYWTVKPRWGGWVFGPYVNHNHYAGLMELLIPIAAGYVFSRSQNRPLQLLLGFTLLIPVASVLLSGSRGGLLALLAESSILIPVFFWRGTAPARRGLALALALGMVIAALLFFWMDPGDVSKRLATLFNPSDFTEKSFGQRSVVAVDSLRIFRDYPWFGVGLGSFETAYPPYQSFPSDEAWNHAHNDYAEALAETGSLGGLLILMFMVTFFARAFSNLEERLKHQVGWIQLGAAVGVCGLLVHSLADFNLHIPANALWFAVCAAWATVCPLGPTHESFPPARR